MVDGARVKPPPGGADLPGTRRDLRRQEQPHKLDIVDQPMVGLLMIDVERLIRVLHRPCDAGGKVVAEGPLGKVVKTRRKSETARVLKEFLAERHA